MKYRGVATIDATEAAASVKKPGIKVEASLRFCILQLTVPISVLALLPWYLSWNTACFI